MWGLTHVGVQIEPGAAQEPPHPPPDRAEHLDHLSVARPTRWVERKPRGRGPDEDPVEGQRVKVHVQVEAAAETLHGGHGPGAAPGDALSLGLLAIELAQRPGMDREHRAAEPVIPRQEVPQPIGQGEHPLAHRDGRNHVVHQVGGTLGHPPAPAARTEPPALAGERDQALERALRAAHASKAVGQHSAGQELTKLPRDKLRQAGPVGGGAQELVQVIPDDPIEYARFRVTRLVASLRTVHAPA